MESDAADVLVELLNSNIGRTSASVSEKVSIIIIVKCSFTANISVLK
jgi:hypothetical protein